MRSFVLAVVLALGTAVALAGFDPLNPGRYRVGSTAVTVYRPPSDVALPTTVWYPATPGGAIRRKRWPLVVFSHGSCLFPSQSTFLVEHLASYGMIVAAPTHVGNALPDGFPTCMEDAALGAAFVSRPLDVAAVIDAVLAGTRDPASIFHHRVSPRRIAVAGHSFGGMTALRLAATDDRIRAVLALAPSLPQLAGAAGLAIPAMIQGATRDGLTSYEGETQAAFGLLAGPRYLVTLVGADHFAFADGCMTFFGSSDCAPDAMPAAEAHEHVLRTAVPFLLRYLTGRRAAGAWLEPGGMPAGVVVDARPRG